MRHLYLELTWRVISLEFRHDVWSDKTRMTCRKRCMIRLTVLLNLTTVTDRQTDRIAIAHTALTRSARRAVKTYSGFIGVFGH